MYLLCCFVNQSVCCQQELGSLGDIFIGPFNAAQVKEIGYEAYFVLVGFHLLDFIQYGFFCQEAVFSILEVDGFFYFSVRAGSVPFFGSVAQDALNFALVCKFFRHLGGLDCTFHFKG